VRTIPDPGFAGDDGTAPETLTVALAAYDADPDAGYLQALAALCTSRLLVPVVAVLGEVGYDEAGLAHDKSSDMAAVLLAEADEDEPPVDEFASEESADFEPFDVPLAERGDLMQAT